MFEQLNKRLTDILCDLDNEITPLSGPLANDAGAELAELAVHAYKLIALLEKLDRDTPKVVNPYGVELPDAPQPQVANVGRAEHGLGWTKVNGIVVGK